MNYMEIGCSPVEEDCVQVGSRPYQAAALAEAHAYRRQLARTYPQAANKLEVKSFPHDFGRYYEVVISNPSSEEDYAVEDGCEKWDQEAIAELRANPDWVAYWQGAKG